MTDLEMARALAAQVARQGGRAYYVGGFVRDRLLGRENKDVDLEIHGISRETLEAILDALGSRLEMGRSFGIYGLRGCQLDIAMPRAERATGPGHKDFAIQVDPFMGVEQAAMRRDFTVNAMLEDVLTGQVVDPFGGQEDLRQGLLRHVSDRSFPEDALRVLRGAQFAARFEFDVAPETAELCRSLDLSSLPRERVLEELRKALLKAREPSRFFRVLRQMDQLGTWFPEVQALAGVPQSPRYHAEGDVWVHTMLVLDQAARRRQEAREPFYFMLAALCHDFGKAVTTEFVKGDYHAYGHETEGLPLAERFLRRLTGEKQLIRYVLNLTQLHMKPHRMVDTSPDKRFNQLFDSCVCPEDLILLATCDDAGSLGGAPRPSRETLLRQRLDTYREYMARPWVTGADLLQAGLEPGESFRTLLEFSHKLRLAGVDKQTALRQVLGEARNLNKN